MVSQLFATIAQILLPSASLNFKKARNSELNLLRAFALKCSLNSHPGNVYINTSNTWLAKSRPRGVSATRSGVHVISPLAVSSLSSVP